MNSRHYKFIRKERKKRKKKEEKEKERKKKKGKRRLGNSAAAKKKTLQKSCSGVHRDWNDIKGQSSMYRKFSPKRKCFATRVLRARPHSSSLVIRVEKFVFLKNTEVAIDYRIISCISTIVTR